MNRSRLFRAALLGICAAVAIPSIAGAQIVRLYDPVTDSYITYDSGPQRDWSLFAEPEYTPSQRTYSAPDPIYAAQVVDFATKEAPGTIIIDTGNKFLYFTLKGGKAIRYGVGVGKEGFGWTGVVEVGAKQEWPSWTPPKEMIKRRPELVKYAGGMPGGPDNPLGARALYLHDNGRDTMFRIHGTNEPWSIGRNVSSGCIRMLNEHVTELYRMARIGAKVIVM